MAYDDVLAVASGSAPRWLAFAGVDCPSMSELSLPARNVYREWPLHLKEKAIGRVGASQRQSILGLSYIHESLHATCEAAFRWLHDASLYEHLLDRAASMGWTFRTDGHAAFTRDEMLEMERLGKLCPDPTPLLRGFSMSCFAHPELQKFRRRIIMETYFNDILRAEDLGEKIKLPSRQDIRDAVVAATLTARALGLSRCSLISLDVAACFDQYRLEPDVQRFYRVAAGVCSGVLTMGTRIACLIVQACNELLADFHHPCVEVFVYIDNFYLVGASPADVKAATLELIHRIRSSNILLNNLPDGGDALALVEQLLSADVVEVLGEVLDLRCCTAALTSGTKEKLLVARSLLDLAHLPVRSACAVFGVLLYASSVVGVSPGDPCKAVDAFRAASAFGASKGWSSSSVGSFSAVSAAVTLAWMQAVETAPPFCFLDAAQRSAHPVDCELTIDASAYGIGAVVYWKGRTSFHSIPWSPAEHAVLAGSSYASTKTEPCASVRAILACAPPAARHILLRTDHLGLVLSSRARLHRLTTKPSAAFARPVQTCW